MKLAKERKVWGVAQLFGHWDLEKITDLRQRIAVWKPANFSDGQERLNRPEPVKNHLDLAKELDGGPSGARHRTGTVKARSTGSIGSQ